MGRKKQIEKPLDENFQDDIQKKVEKRIDKHKSHIQKTGHNKIKRSVTQYLTPKTLHIGRKVNQDRLIRVHTVARCMAEGQQALTIFDKYGKKWGCSIENIYQYRSEARELFTKDLLSGQGLADDILHKYFYLYEKCVEEEDFEGARKVLDSIGNLTKTIKIDVTSGGESFVSPTTIKLVEIANDKIEDIDFEEDE